jgi:hypothetical protein
LALTGSTLTAVGSITGHNLGSVVFDLPDARMPAISQHPCALLGKANACE